MKQGDNNNINNSHSECQVPDFNTQLVVCLNIGSNNVR